MNLLKDTKNNLYAMTRTTGKIASVLSDIDIFTSGDPKRIKRRLKSKMLYKTSNNIVRKILK